RTGSQLRAGMGESRCSMAVMVLNVIAGGRRYIRQAPGEKEKPLETVIIKGFCIRGTASDVESEVHYIPVLDDVFLAFQAPLAGFLGAGFAVVLDEVIIGDHFGANEAFLEISMNHAGALGGGGADLDGPGADFLDPGGEVGLQVEQLVAGADHAVQAGLFHADGFKEHVLLFTVIQLGDFRFDLVAYRYHHSTFGVGDLTHDIEVGIVLEAFFGDVGDVHHRLAGQQVKALDQLLLVVSQILDQSTGRLAFAEVGDELFQQGLLRYGFLVATLGIARDALQLLLAAVEVGEDQFQVDDFDIALGVDTVGDVDHVFII